MLIKRLNLAENIGLEGIPELLDREGIGFEKIGCDNWNWSGRNPEVLFRAVHASDRIIIHFHVKDNELRAVETQNDGRVWEDSCCEFFVSPQGNDFYYNFECNCIGTLLLHGGVVGTERPSAPESVYDSVRRWSSIGCEPFDAKEEDREWDLVEVIPAGALFASGIPAFDGLTMKGNFYKCGDLLPHPHFLSWAPIDLPQPAFHCPQFFRELKFE